MHRIVSECEFVDEMTKRGFTYEGATALFEFLEESAGEYGWELKSSPKAFKAFAASFKEYASLEEVKKNYTVKSIEFLEKETTVIKIPKNGGFIIAARPWQIWVFMDV